MLGDSFAAARTSDGNYWVAWIETTLDLTVSWEPSCFGEECDCVREILDDSSTAELHLLRVTPTDPPEEILTLPVDSPLFDGFKGSRSFDARAFGSRIAIGMQLGNGPDSYSSSTKLWLLEYDTALLP